MTTVVISQPMLFPWPGFFEQLMLADNYLFLDDVQFSKGSFTNRIQIKSEGKLTWLTIALKNSGTLRRICELEPANVQWRDKHLSQISHAYRKAPFFSDVMRLAESVYSKGSICEVLIASIVESADYLAIGQRQVRARTSELHVAGSSSARVLGLVQRCNGTRYLTGHGAKNYLDHEIFEAVDIAVEYMNYSKTQWPQQGTEFTPFVTVLDLIANTGKLARDYLHPATFDWRIHLKRIYAG